MASLVKEDALDEEKMAGWSRIGIRRKAAAESAGRGAGSAGGTLFFAGTLMIPMVPGTWSEVFSIKPLSEHIKQ